MRSVLYSISVRLLLEVPQRKAALCGACERSTPDYDAVNVASEVVMSDALPVTSTGPETPELF